MKIKAKYTWGKLKKGNVKLFSTFLIAAFLFLLLTKLSKDYTQEIVINVALENLEDEFVIIDDSLPQVNVTVRAKGFSLLKYIFNNGKNISIDAQTETFKKNNGLYWDIKNKKYKLNNLFGESVDILDVKPDTIAFKYDILASKMVPVVLNKKITFSDGFDVVNDFKLSQDSIKIVGSQQIIDTIDVINTVDFKQDNLNQDVSKIIALRDVKSVELIPNELSVFGKVRRFTEGKFTLPVALINAPIDKRVNIFPKQVDLVYYVDVENFTNVKPEDFRLICDFNTVKNDLQSTLEIQIIKKSHLVKRMRLLQNNVEFIISKQ